MDLDAILGQFELYNKIQSTEVLDRLLPDYLRNAELATQEGKPNQGKEVAKMIDKNDLSSKSVIFHEKCEIGLYLDFGNSEEDVINGTAHRTSYQRAHDIAEKLELKLLQYVGEIVYGRKIPLHVLFATRPSMQMFDPELRVINSRMWRYMQHNTGFGLTSGIETYVPMKFDPGEVALSFELFERFGSEYTSEFKEQAQGVIKNFVLSTNSEYEKQATQVAWWLQPQVPTPTRF